MSFNRAILRSFDIGLLGTPNRMLRAREIIDIDELLISPHGYPYAKPVTGQIFRSFGLTRIFFRIYSALEAHDPFVKLTPLLMGTSEFDGQGFPVSPVEEFGEVPGAFTEQDGSPTIHEVPMWSIVSLSHIRLDFELDIPDEGAPPFEVKLYVEQWVEGFSLRRDPDVGLQTLGSSVEDVNLEQTDFRLDPSLSDYLLEARVI